MLSNIVFFLVGPDQADNNIDTNICSGSTSNESFYRSDVASQIKICPVWTVDVYSDICVIQTWFRYELD